MSCPLKRTFYFCLRLMLLLMVKRCRYYFDLVMYERVELILKGVKCNYHARCIAVLHTLEY